MSTSTYALVFQGRISEYADPEQARERFAKIFSLSEEKLEQAFSVERTVLKKNLTQADAEKYQTKLEQMGILVVIENLDPQAGQNSGLIIEDATSADAYAPQDPLAVNDFDHTASEVPEPINDGESRRVPFIFSGNGAEYFRIWIVNLLLSIVTLGIYSAWAKVRNKRYFYGHTSLDGSTFEYTAEPMNILKGRLIAMAFFIVYSVAGSISLILGGIMGVAVMLFVPWMVVRSMNFNARNSVYRNVSFTFTGEWVGGLKAFVLWPLAGVLTFGILLPLAIFKQQQFLVSNHNLGQTGFKFNASVKDYYKCVFMAIGLLVAVIAVASILIGSMGIMGYIFGIVMMMAAYIAVIAMMVVFLFNLRFNHTLIEQHGFEASMTVSSYTGLMVVNTLLTVLTLGFYYPWAKVKVAQYKADHLQLMAEGDLDGFVAAKAEETNALGQEMGDMFDFDFAI